MKKPYYYLKEDINFSDESQNHIVFKSGQLITPILDDRYLPAHLKKIIDDANHWKKEENKQVLCLIGKYWIPVELSKIKEVI